MADDDQVTDEPESENPHELAWRRQARRNNAWAYRRIEDRGKERFDPEKVRAAYYDVFKVSLCEDVLDDHMVSYAMVDSQTIGEYIEYCKWREMNDSN